MEKRTILFRGKRVDNGEWITGDLIANSASPFVFIRADVGLKVDDPIRGKDVKVIQDTIGQFTGLTDKNGKRIFEGDVVKMCRSYGHQFLPLGAFSVVKWDEKELCYRLKDSFRLTESKKVEVIGNIHDNPELS